ncbi:MAG: hypothetical protein ACI9CF_001394, partial [Candidatus Omnitrophota bacterium]
MFKKLKIISWMVLLAFALEQVGIAMPDGAAKLGLPNPSMMTTPKTGLTSILANPSELKIPFEYVNLQEVHQGTNGKLIIHIQDAHANLSGQQNIAHTLNALMSQYDIPLVLSEGGSGNASLGSIRSLMSKKDLLIGSKRLLQENLIAGHEYLNLTSEHEMRIQGIEDMRLYNQNLLAYAALKNSRQAALAYLRQINQSIQRIKNQLYPKKILNYEERKNRKVNKQNWDHSTQLTELAKSQDIALGDYLMIQQLVGIKEAEAQIDFRKVNAEQTSILDRMSAAELQHIKMTHTSPAAQLATLNKIITQAEAKGIPTQALREIQKYKNYLSEFATLDFDQLLNGLNKLESEVYAQFLTSTELNTLHAIDDHIKLLQKAYKIQLNNAENRQLQLNADVFLPAAWQAFLNKQLGQLGFFEDMIAHQPVLDETKEQISNFYELVNQRDLSFIQKTKEQLADRKQDAAFLITGGYHTQHLTQLLKEQNYSYIVLTPIIQEATDHKQYENRLLSALEVIQKDTLSMSLAADGSGNSIPRMTQFIERNQNSESMEVSKHILQLQFKKSRMVERVMLDHEELEDEGSARLASNSLDPQNNIQGIQFEAIPQARDNARMADPALSQLLIQIKATDLHKKIILGSSRTEEDKISLINYLFNNSMKFNGSQIATILKSKRTKTEITSIINELQDIKENNTQVFNGSQIATILKSKRTKTEITSIINELQDIKENNTQVFNGSQIAIILKSKRTKSEITSIINELQDIKENNTQVFNGSQIATILKSKRTKTEITSIINELQDIKENNTQVFNGYQIATILKSKRTKTEITSIINELQDIKENNTQVFNG